MANPRFSYIVDPLTTMNEHDAVGVGDRGGEILTGWNISAISDCPAVKKYAP